MRRLLTTFIFYFRWLRTMAWSSAIGMTLLLIGLASPSHQWLLPIFIGTITGIGIPVLYGGIAYRQLISNKHMLMIPELRIFASASILLLAIAAVVLCLPLASLIAPDAELSTSAPLLFVTVSGQLLISQWLVTYETGMITFWVAPLVIARLAYWDIPAFGSLIETPMLLLSLALAGWIWLFAASKSRVAPRPASSAVKTQISGTNSGDSQKSLWWQWQPARAATPAGTMMHGRRDGLINRAVAIATYVVIFPVSIWLMLWLIEMLFGTRMTSRNEVEFLLIWSLFGMTMSATMIYAEWPASMRRIWLRAPGDRLASWRRIDRSLAQELILVGVATTFVALALNAFTEADRIHLALYVAGSITLMALGAYLGFWIRVMNWPRLMLAISMIGLMLICLGSVVLLGILDSVAQTFWILPILAALAATFRALARHRFARIDWCTVRPLRVTRTR